MEDRYHEEDVPFYGHRRRNQAQFRADVATNCNDRCVATGASIIRCEAAHLVQHARKGGASFKMDYYYVQTYTACSIWAQWRLTQNSLLCTSPQKF